MCVLSELNYLASFLPAEQTLQGVSRRVSRWRRRESLERYEVSRCRRQSRYCYQLRIQGLQRNMYAVAVLLMLLLSFMLMVFGWCLMYGDAALVLLVKSVVGGFLTAVGLNFYCFLPSLVDVA